MGFMDDYGPGAPLAEGYGRHGLHYPAQSLTSSLEWFGVVGAIVGFFCGIALVWLPLVVIYFYVM